MVALLIAYYSHYCKAIVGFIWDNINITKYLGYSFFNTIDLNKVKKWITSDANIKVKAQSSYNVSRLAIAQIGKHSSVWLRGQIVDHIQNLGAPPNILRTSLS